MPSRLWVHDPEHYSKCGRCRGTGQIDCLWCNGNGGVVGPDRYIIGGRIGRRFGLKVCDLCRGSGKISCGICSSGSVRKA